MNETKGDVAQATCFWRGTYTHPAPCTAQPSPNARASPQRALLTGNDELVAVLALVTRLFPSIAGMQQRRGQLLQRRKMSSGLAQILGLAEAACIACPTGGGRTAWTVQLDRKAKLNQTWYSAIRPAP